MSEWRTAFEYTQAKRKKYLDSLSNSSLLDTLLEAAIAIGRDDGRGIDGEYIDDSCYYYLKAEFERRLYHWLEQ